MDAEETCIKTVKNNKLPKMGQNAKESRDIYENYNEKLSNFENFFCSYSDFIEMVNLYKKKLSNSTLNGDSSFVEVLKQEKEYFNELNSLFEMEFTKISNAFEEDLYSFYCRAKLFISSDNNVLESIRTNEIKMLASLDVVKDVLNIYNLKDNADASFKLYFPADYGPLPKKILKGSKWINLGEKLFVTGGSHKKENREIFSKKAFYIYYFSSVSENNDVRDVEVVKDMLFERDQHCLLHINSFQIAAIGGSKTKECEMYDILQDKWTQFSELPVCISNASAVLVDRLTIYLFFGNIVKTNKNKKVMIDYNLQILRYKLFCENSNWEDIPFFSVYPMNLANFAILKNNNNIYIVGGKFHNESGLETNTKNIYEYDLEHSRLELTKFTLPKIASFFESNFITTGNNEFGLYSMDFYLVKLKI